MKEDLLIVNTLKDHDFNNIEIYQILNYLETLEYDLTQTKYIGQIRSKNERLAKYFFLRDKLSIDIDSSENSFYINEILDQCIDWSEFWRLLVLKKGFCCISLSAELLIRKRFVFFAGPNILSGPTSDLADSIYED